MKNISTGYTLIELIMAMSLLIIVLTGGTAIFYRSFRSSGVSDVQSTLNNSLRALDGLMEQSLQFGTVVRVVDSFGVDKYRSDCIAAGSIVGNTLALKDLSGGVIVYQLDSGQERVASNSGFISSPDVKITKLQFTWSCRSGVNDKINLQMTATPNDNSSEITEASFEKDINLLNSGIN